MFAVLIIMKRNTTQHNKIDQNNRKSGQTTAEPRSIIIDGVVAVVDFEKKKKIFNCCSLRCVQFFSTIYSPSVRMDRMDREREKKLNE